MILLYGVFLVKYRISKISFIIVHDRNITSVSIFSVGDLIGSDLTDNFGLALVWWAGARYR